MINNFLAGGNQEYIVGDPSTNVFFFNGQKGISETLIAIVFICIPIMLCTKPCVMLFCQKPHHDEHVDQFDQVEPNEENGGTARPSLMGAQADIKAYNELLN